MTEIEKKQKELKEYRNLKKSLNKELPTLKSVMNNLNNISDLLNENFSIDNKGIDNGKIKNISSMLNSYINLIENTFLKEIESERNKIYNEITIIAAGK